MHIINIEEDRIGLRFGVTQENRLVLLAVTEGKKRQQASEMQEAAFEQKDGAEAGNEDAFREYAPLEAMITGENCPEDRMWNQLIHTSLAMKLHYERHERRQTEDGAEYVFFLKDEDTGMAARLHYRFYAELNVISCHTEVENRGTLPQGLEAVTSFSLHVLERDGNLSYEERFRLHLVHNGWQKELQWHAYRFSELGLTASQKPGRYNSTKFISVTNMGAWSTKQYLPLGILEDEETGKFLAWQIEHNGSWHW